MNKFIINHQTIILILFFLASTGFYSFKPIVEDGKLIVIYKFACVFLLFFLWKCIFKRTSNRIYYWMKIIIVIFIMGSLWATLFHSQSPVKSISGMAEDMPLLLFFFLCHYNYQKKAILKTFIILAVLYTVVLIHSLATFPNNIFAYSNDPEVLEKILNTFRERGMLRIGVPGADLVIVLFFMVLTYFRGKKFWYLSLIPIIVIMLLRGTRTPVFMSIFIASIFLIRHIRYKWLIILCLFVLYWGSVITYNKILKSDSEDPVSMYVKLTLSQIEDNKDEKNIRLEMTEYFVTRYNTNFLEYIVGNGKPSGNEEYNAGLIKLGDQRGYFIVDSGISYIFVYYGVIGLVAYAMLFIVIIRTPVEQKYMFAKLYVIYGYLILPTNVSILWIAPTIFAMNIYLVYRSNLDLKLAKNNVEVKNAFIKY